MDGNFDPWNIYCVSQLMRYFVLSEQATGEDQDESSQQMMARPNKRTKVGPYRITNKAILHITRRRIGAWTYGPIKNDVIISGHLSEIDN